MIRNIFVWLLIAALAGLPASASQNQLSTPTTGTVSGVQLSNNLNNALDSVNTCNSGASAPTNQLSGVPSLGNCWLNTTNSSLNYYDGTSWVTLGWSDTSGHIFLPQLGGGLDSTVASATTTNLCGASQASVRSPNVTISGTVTISSFGSNCFSGQYKLITFSGILALTYNASSMILPTAANITTAVNDTALAKYLGGGSSQTVIYQRANGSALSSSLNFTGALFINGAITPSSLGTSQNNYSPAGLSTANVIRQASSANVNVTGIAAPATNGQRLTIQNINNAATFSITLTANDANSTSGNRFLFPHPVGIQPLQSLTIVYDATASGWRLEQKIYASPYQGGFKNLRVFNVADFYGDTAPSTPNSQIKIAADEIILEDTNGNVTKSAYISPCTVDFTTNGAGGLDTGSLATGNWYFIFVIFNPTTNTSSCLGSLQSAVGSVTLPSGYTFAARVGANYYSLANSVTGFQRVIQYGRRARLISTASSPTATLPQIVAGTSGSISVPTFTAESVAAFVPATASAINLTVTAQNSTACAVMVAPNNAFPAYTNTINANPPPFVVLGGGNPLSVSGLMDLQTGSTYYASNCSGGGMSVNGWEDNL